jgi:hypothetical protein
VSETTIEQHRANWSHLPTFAPLPVSDHPVTVDDVEFCCDLAYLRDLLDAIEDQAARGGRWDAAAATVVFDLRGIPDDLLDWPVDRAAELLDAWRGTENSTLHIISEAVQ